MGELSIENKELLLKDLCARLPYGVKVQIPVMNDEITLTCGDISAYFFNPDNKLFLKPYLRPMSSMTEEEKIEYRNLHHTEKCRHFNNVWEFDVVYSRDIPLYIDWLNAHHFDYRWLIEKGLALEAHEGMYK